MALDIDNTMKVVAGQSFLYKPHGSESEVFEITFTEPVEGGFLNHALALALARHSYFNTQLYLEDGTYYLERNDHMIFARETERLPVLGSERDTRHLVAVTFHGCKVAVSFHHAICDGHGIKPFIESLIYYYCYFRYHNTERIEGIRRADDFLFDDEIRDPFTDFFDFDEEKANRVTKIDRDGFALPESNTSESIDYRYVVRFSQADFMRLCKENGATPSVLFSILMSRAIAKLYPDYDKPINANVAVDIRSAIGAEHAFVNCVNTVILPYTREFAALPLAEQSKRFRALLDEQRGRDYCRKVANSMVGLFKKLDSMRTYEEKVQFMSFLDGFKLTTFILSYIGQFTLSSNEKYVKSINLFNSGAVGLNINMICACGKFVLDFKQSFKDSTYFDGFCEELSSLGIAHEKEGAILFLTPKDALGQTL